MNDSTEPEGEASCETDAEKQGDSNVEDPCQKLAHNNLQPPDVGDVRRVCPSCGRHFNPSSWERHKRVCQQVFRSTRPQFDAFKGSAIKGTPVRVVPPKQEMQLPGASVATLRQADSMPSVPSTPNGGQRVVESIEDHEQRVMNMLQQQLEELRDLRRQCSQAKDGKISNYYEGEQLLAKPSRRSPSPPKVSTSCDIGSKAVASTSPVVMVGSNVASGSHLSRRRSHDTPAINAVAAETGAGLKVCEDCGRSFNPASFEKHRAVCRNVFVKPDRTPFESHRQRLRSLQGGCDASPSRDRAVCKEDLYRSRSGESIAASSAPPKPIVARKTCLRSSKAGVVTPGSPNMGTSVGSRQTSAFDETSTDCVSGLSRLTSPQRALIPCPHCGRSFGAAGFDKHVKVCQSVFPTHDARSDHRYVYDSRRHRLKGTGFEAYRSVSPQTPPHGDRACSSTPPMPPRTISSTQARGSSRSPKAQLHRATSESQIPYFGASRSTSPLAPSATALIVSHCSSPSEDQSTGQRERYENKATNASPTSDIVSDLAVRVTQGLSAASPENHQDVQRFLEDRRGKLERARLDVKISQRPEFSALLGGSASEKIIRRYSKITFEQDDSLGKASVTQLTPLQALVEGNCKSSGIDFSSHYERCLEHLDSIQEPQFVTSVPESIASLSMTREHSAKPGLAREDPSPGIEPLMTSQPKSVGTNREDALRLEASQQQTGSQADGFGQCTTISDVDESSRHRTPIGSAPCFLRAKPIGPIPSAVTLRGFDSVEVPFPAEVVPPLSSTVPAVQATPVPIPSPHVITERGQFVPRLDLRKVSQAQICVQASSLALR